MKNRIMFVNLDENLSFHIHLYINYDSRFFFTLFSHKYSTIVDVFYN